MKKRIKTNRRQICFETLENRNLLASISGVVFADTNGSGIQDAGESPLAGWTVLQDNNGNSVADTGEPRALTGADGTYLFAIPQVTVPTAIYVSAILPAAETAGRWLNTNNSYVRAVFRPTDIPDAVVTIHFGFQFVPFASFAPVGGESLVNQTTAGQQGLTVQGDERGNANTVASDGTGNYAAAWIAPGTSTADQVYVRVFNANGSARTTEIKVADSVRATGGVVTTPRVAMSQDGSRIVVSWVNYNSTHSTFETYAQVFDANGNGIGSRQQVAGYKKNQGFSVTGLAMDGDGDFAVLIANTSTATYQFQRYTRQGVANGSMVPVAVGNFQNPVPAMAIDSLGNAVVTWGELNGIYAQRFNSSGAKVGSKITLITGSTSDNRSPSVAMNATGRFVVTWDSNYNAGTDINRIKVAQAFDSAGVPVGSRITFSRPGNRGGPAAVTMDASANITFAWADGPAYPWYNIAKNNAVEILVRRLSSLGVLSEIQAVNTTTEGNQSLPSVAATPNGFVVSWSGRGVGDDMGVFSQRYTTNVSQSAAMRTASDTSAPKASVVDAALVDFLVSSNEDTKLSKSRGFGLVGRAKP